MSSDTPNKKLHILTESEIGYGILVENDAGSISPNFELNAKLIREMKEGQIDYSQPIIMYATLQKYDVENRNGRIYPEDILRREVQRYQKIIDMNASFNEIDHPDCVSASSSILCKNGWKLIKDIAEDEEVYTLNKDNGNIELQQITKKIYEPYKGKMIEIKGRNIDLLVTPNHRFIFTNRVTGENKFYVAQDILDGKIDRSEYYIPKLGNWIGNDHEIITIQKINELTKNMVNENYLSNLTIKATDFFAFMGIYLSEGCAIGSKGSKRKNKITITQKSGNKANQIRELLNNMPIDWREYYSEKEDKITFATYDPRLYNYLFPLGNSHTKYIPEELKQASPRLLNILLEWFLIGDGRTRKVKNYSACEVFSTSEKLINDLHEILIKAGGAGNVHTEIPIDRNIVDKNGVTRLIEAKNSKPMHFLHISTTKGLWLDKRFVSVKEVNYEGYIACVSVPNETFYVKNNGKSLWSGNSSVVSLTKGSPYRILEMFWQGNALIGKLEILVSRGYREHGGLYCGGDMVALYLSYGMTLGVSSRGVGTLKNVNGKKMVQQDFELICFDAVSSPSTPGSYIYRSIEDFSKYDEKLNKPTSNSEPNNPTNEFMNKLNYFLNPKNKK